MSDSGKEKKKVSTKKKSTGIAAYTKKVQSAPKVKSADKMIKALESKLKAAKKKKAAAVKEVRKKLK